MQWTTTAPADLCSRWSCGTSPLGTAKGTPQLASEKAYPESSCHASFHVALIKTQDPSSSPSKASPTSLSISFGAGRKPAGLPIAKYCGFFSCTSIYNSLKHYTAPSFFWLKTNTTCKGLSHLPMSMGQPCPGNIFFC